MATSDGVWEQSFGLVLQDFLRGIRAKHRDKVRSLIESSPAFLGMIRTLSTRIVYLPLTSASFDQSKPHRWIGPEGWLLQYHPTKYWSLIDQWSGENTPVQPRRRGIEVVRSENGSFWEAAPRVLGASQMQYDTIHVAVPDALSPAAGLLSESMPSDSDFFRLVTTLAHEMKHAVRTYDLLFGRGGRTSGRTGLRAFIDDEIATREVDSDVGREIGDPTAQRGFKPISIEAKIAFIEGGSQRADVERSFGSPRPTTTYVERFFFQGIYAQAPSPLDGGRVEAIRREIARLFGRDSFGRSGLDSLKDPLATLTLLTGAIRDLLAQKEKASSEDFFGVTYLAESIIGARWNRFSEEFRGKPEYFDGKERLLKEHADILFKGSDVAYTPRIPRVIR